MVFPSVPLLVCEALLLYGLVFFKVINTIIIQKINKNKDMLHGRGVWKLYI